MKQLSRTYRASGLMALLMMSAIEASGAGEPIAVSPAADAANVVAPEVPVTQSAEVAAGLVSSDPAVAPPAIPPAPGATPAAPKPLTAAQQKKADEKAAKEKAKADKAAAKAAEAKPATTTDSQNGVTRPGSGKTKEVWDTADKMSAAIKAPIGRKELTDALLAQGLVVGTIHTQYGKWRKYHGLVTEKAVPAVAPAAPEAPAAV